MDLFPLSLIHINQKRNSGKKHGVIQFQNLMLVFFKNIIKLIAKSFKDVKNLIELDYPELYDESKLIPVEGKAGTLIVFDSDLFHQGGKINKKGAERIVIRMHNYLS